jgi:hypothetical protein
LTPAALNYLRKGQGHAALVRRDRTFSASKEASAASAFAGSCRTRRTARRSRPTCLAMAIARTMQQQRVRPKAIYSVLGSAASSYKFVKELPEAATYIIDCRKRIRSMP